MGSSTSIMRPQELIEFRKLNTSIENVDIPARPESRSLTDKKGFLIYGIALLVFLPFFIYTLAKSDLRHYVTGADDCGNLCGYENPSIEGVACSGQDHTIRPYHTLTDDCVTSCPSGTSAYLGTCIRQKSRSSRFDDDFEYNFRNRFRRSTYRNNIGEDPYVYVKDTRELMGNEGWKILASTLIAIVLCLLVLLLLRLVPAVLIWSIIIFSALLLVLLCGILWYGYSRSDGARPLLIMASGWTIFTLIMLAIFIALFKKIGLCIQLYKEAVKVMVAMPLLAIIPILTTIVEILVTLAWLVSTVYMMSARELNKYSESHYKYEFTGVMLFSTIFNFIMMCWTVRLIAGVQYMIVSGSVASWYFAKNKKYLDSPICTSLCNTMKYHIGTIAYGSFILTAFAVVKMIIKSIIRNVCCRCLIVWCCSGVEVILRFLSENSYIETAIHGQSYFRSAKRATKLLLTNAKSMIAINCVGDFILGMIIFLLVLATTAISAALFMPDDVIYAFPLSICVIINIIVICVIFGNIQTIIDSLFICFCEDTVINDGISRPYFMSRGLMEFVENSKKVYQEKNSR